MFITLEFLFQFKLVVASVGNYILTVLYSGAETGMKIRWGAFVFLLRREPCK